jgi:hypothetical protein
VGRGRGSCALNVAYVLERFLDIWCESLVDVGFEWSRQVYLDLAMLHTQSGPVLHGNLVALDLELCLQSHVLNRRRQERWQVRRVGARSF